MNEDIMIDNWIYRSTQRIIVIIVYKHIEMYNMFAVKCIKIMKNIYEKGLRFAMNDLSQCYEELLTLTK